MQALERHKAFPYIAWGTMLLFTMFTYYLVLQLQEAVAGLEERTQQNVTAVREA